jgi:hypothetical protein
MEKKEINKVINSLASVIHKDSLSASSEFVNNMLQLMNKDTMTNPEMFNLFVCYPCNSQINNLIETINTLYEKSDKVSGKNLSKFVFLFKNYTYLERHIEELVTSKSGTSACSCDIARYLLKNVYLHYLKTDVILDMKVNEEKYYKPSFGTNDEWIDYIESLRDLFYGKTEKYFISYKKMLDSKIRKYKHIVHYHKITYLKNNMTFEMPCTFDNDKEVHLQKSIDGKNYKILRFMIPKDLLPAYTSVYESATGSDKTMSAGYYFVPITDVSIKTESKEKFI